VEQKIRQARTAQAIRFGVYEVDLEAGELRKRGVKVSLQEQPFQVLALLIAHPGQLLTREALQKQLWPEDALVDFDLGLNTAVKKIRTALEDSAENPRFVETLPRRGYRFIAPVQEIKRDVGSVVPTVSESLSRPLHDEVTAQVSTTGSRIPKTASVEEDLLLPPTVVVRHEHSASKQNAKQSELESKESAPVGDESVPDFVRPAMTLRPGRQKKYGYYWVLILVLVIVAGFLVGQGETEKRHLSSGQNLPKRGAYVYRTTTKPNESAAIGIGGYDLKSPNDQVFAFDYDHNGKLDHLVLFRPGVGRIWIVENSGGTFGPVYEGDGIGGYDLKSPHDRVFAFDYDHSGKLDHLVIYRPGTEILWIVKNNGRGTFTPVYKHAQSDTALWSRAHDQLSTADQVFAFDYDHSGKLDHLVLYRPGLEIITILKNSGGSLTPVYTQHVASGQIDGNGPQPFTDQAFAFDYDHSGKLDYLVLYRPGTGTFSILKNSGEALTPVYTSSGIGGYDLKSMNDRAFAFDYGQSGKLDYLLLYRPGTGLLSILKNSGGTFTPISEGIGVKGYDLKSPHDRAFAFDYDHSGKLDHLVFYRPGTGDVLISYFPRQR